jgi:hypothetical protein
MADPWLETFSAYQPLTCNSELFLVRVLTTMTSPVEIANR